MDVITLALAKKYTEETVKGGGALKGVNCTIKSIEAVPEGNKVTFEWTLTDGSKKTDFIIIKDGVDGKDGKDGIDGIDGEKGDKGDQGDKGIGIESITKKSSAGLVDTYLIVFTDGTESSFDVVNGANITKTSQLENDSNFITNIVNNLLNYYTKDEVYTKANIDELLRNIGAGLSVKIVAALPTEEISGTTIYLIKTSGNNYNQYMWIDNAWANLGSTTVDLSNYYTKDKVDEILLGYVTKDVLTSVLIDYVKKSELAKVATSNDYNDLDNLPEIPDVSGIKPYTNVLQDSENTAPTSKALYDAVSGINSEVEKKADSDDVPTKVTDLKDAEDYAKSSDVGNISELSTTDKSSAVAAINEINDSLVDIEDALEDKADKTELDGSKKLYITNTGANIKFVKIASAPTSGSSIDIHFKSARTNTTFEEETVRVANYMSKTVYDGKIIQKSVYAVSGNTPSESEANFIVILDDYSVWAHIASYSTAEIELYSYGRNKNIDGTEATTLPSEVKYSMFNGTELATMDKVAKIEQLTSTEKAKWSDLSSSHQTLVKYLQKDDGTQGIGVYVDGTLYTIIPFAKISM